MTAGRGLIKAVTAISTGWGEVHPEHIFGTKKPTLWWILMSRRWVPIPINVFVIEHTRGLVLFDTGMDRAAVTKSDYFPDKVTAFFMRHVFRFHQGPEDTLTRQLELAGYKARDVRAAVMSHLHFDHAGGIREIPQAELIATEEAWDHMMGPHPEREGVLRRDLNVPGASWRLITFPRVDDPALGPFTHSLDLMGDRSIVLLPVQGHLPGSLAMLIRRQDGPPLFLIGDLAYNLRAFERGQVPGTGDAEQLRASYDQVADLKALMPDLLVIPSHDEEAVGWLRRAS